MYKKLIECKMLPGALLDEGFFEMTPAVKYLTAFLVDGVSGVVVGRDQLISQRLQLSYLLLLYKETCVIN